MIRRTITAAMVFFGLLAAGSGQAAGGLPPVEKIRLPNELTILVSEDRTLPSVTVRLLLGAGSGRDPEGKAGLANLAAQGLLLGTETRTVAEINRALDFIGANLSAFCDRDAAGMALEVLRKHFPTGFEIFLDCLLRPQFPEEEIAAEIERIRGQIRARKDQPGTVAQKAFYRNLFPGSAYGHPVEGTDRTLKTLVRQDVLDFYGSMYRPRDAVIAVVGDITAAEVQSVLAGRLEDWTAGSDSAAPAAADAATESRTVEIDRDITQANIVVGHGGIARSNPDYYAVAVMNYILGGGGFSSRLVQKIRVERGWAYSVSSRFSAWKHTGAFQVVLQTKNETAQAAVGIVLDQMQRLRREPVTPQELQTARKYLTGSFPLRFDSHGELAGFLCGLHYYELGLDYPEQYTARIEAVTLDAVQQAARRYLHPERAIRVVVGDLETAAIP